MCGLVGYFGKWVLNREKAFLDLLRMDVLRGSDSTGVAFFSTNGALKICKDAILPENLIASKEFKKPLAMMWDGYLGHNRWATTGKINKNNSHPFIHGNIVGSHNGTLRWRNQLADYKNFEVDSENIIHSINKEGIAETWSKVDGAAAMSWWDRGLKTLNLLRNSERMLYFASPVEGEGVFWASESWMLTGATERNGVVLDKIFILPENILHSYSFPVKEEEKDREFSLTETKLDGFKLPVYSYVGYKSPYGDWDADYGETKALTTTVKELFKRPEILNKENFKQGRYALIPEQIFKTFNSNKLSSIRMIASLKKSPEIKVELSLTEAEEASYSKYLPGGSSPFSYVLFVAEVTKMNMFSKKGRSTILIGNIKTVKIIVPTDSYRCMFTGERLVKEEFDAKHFECIACKAQINFCDMGFAEDVQSDKILCGKCVQEAESKDNTGFGVDQIFDMARNEK